MRPLRGLTAAVIAVLAAAAPAQAIVGGSATTGGTGAYPWQVAVITSQDQEQWLCGGTLVASDLVLTAAHCVIGDDGRIALPGQVKVLSGNTNIDNTTFSQAIDVGLYPGLDLSRSVPSGDLAIVHLPIAAPGGAPLPVVGAAESSLWDVGARLRITGWGVTSAGSDQSVKVLRWASVFRDPDDTCTSDYGGDFVTGTMFCAGVPGGGVDTCQGDSGGPIAAALTNPTQLSNPDAWRLVGVTSWGTGCGDPGKPGVYTRLGEPALAAFATDPSPVWAPVNVTAPAMPSSATVGDVVTCTPGTWTGEDLTFTYEFHRRQADGSTVVVQTGASNTYTVAAADTTGLSCTELAHNGGGTAWASSSATPVTPASVPPTQIPSPETPRTPVPDTVIGRVVGPATDGASPRASGARARCAKRRCTVTVSVTDAAPSSGIRRVTGTLTWSQACRKKGHRARCAKTRRVSGTKGTGTTWTLRLPRLPRGSASISIVAVDRSGRIQTAPATLTFRVR
jgi:hypothetical protein